MKKLLQQLTVLGIVLGLTLSGQIESQAAELSEDDVYLLQQVSLAEAENQGAEGVAYVMQAIVNRVESDMFPDTVYGVISERDQFAVYSKGTYKNKKPNETSLEALDLMYELENNGQTYFLNDHGNSNNWHSRNLTYCFQYKDHKFYK